MPLDEKGQPVAPSFLEELQQNQNPGGLLGVLQSIGNIGNAIGLGVRDPQAFQKMQQEQRAIKSLASSPATENLTGARRQAALQYLQSGQLDKFTNLLNEQQKANQTQQQTQALLNVMGIPQEQQAAYAGLEPQHILGLEAAKRSNANLDLSEQRLREDQKAKRKKEETLTSLGESIEPQIAALPASQQKFVRGLIANGDINAALSIVKPKVPKKGTPQDLFKQAAEGSVNINDPDSVANYFKSTLPKKQAEAAATNFLKAYTEQPGIFGRIGESLGLSSSRNITPAASQALEAAGQGLPIAAPSTTPKTIRLQAPNGQVQDVLDTPANREKAVKGKFKVLNGG